MKRWVWSVGVVAAVSAAACGGGGSRGKLTVELAPLPVSAMSCPLGPEGLPQNVQCIGVTACRRTATGCDPVRLARPEGDHGAGSSELRFTTSAASTLRFDVMGAPDDLFDVRVSYYDATGAPVASGTLRRAKFGADALRVRLYRSGEWSCAGSGGDEMRPFDSRALHAMTALPNGDVLVYGGVFGDMINVKGVRPMTTGAALRRTMEVYDATAERFYRVPGGELFARVLFASALVPGPDAGPYRIRVVGGYTATEGAVLRFDGAQDRNPHGLPLLAVNGVMPAEPVDIVYDPVRRTATVESTALPGVERAGFDVMTGFGATDRAAAVVLGARDFTGDPPRATFTASAFWLSTDGLLMNAGATVLGTTRLGATVSRVAGLQPSALVWGGALGPSGAGFSTTNAARALAGESLRPGMPAMPLLGGVQRACTDPNPTGPFPPATLPEPTSFHTATETPDGILLAGGLLVSGADCADTPITSASPYRPIVLLTTALGSVTGAVDVTTPVGFVSTIFHTATAMEASGRTEVVVLGGSVRVGLPMGDNTQFYPVTQAGRVVRGGTAAAPTWTYEALRPMAIGRWGHAAAVLPGRRILVTGGFVRSGRDDAAILRALDDAEVLDLSTPPPTIGACMDVVGGLPTDGGATSDGAAMDGARPDGGVVRLDGAPAGDTGAAAIEDAGVDLGAGG